MSGIMYSQGEKSRNRISLHKRKEFQREFACSLHVRVEHLRVIRLLPRPVRCDLLLVSPVVTCREGGFQDGPQKVMQ